MGSSNEKIVTHIQIVKTCHYSHPLLIVILIVFKEINEEVISGTTVSSYYDSKIASILQVSLLAVIL